MEKIMKKHIREESGVAVVEATLYLPLVIAFVITLIYVAFFYMEEYAMFYVVERAANVAAREAAYPGYSTLNLNMDGDFEFSWSGDTPTKTDVENYYKGHYSQEKNTDRSSILVLYREIARWVTKKDYTELTDDCDNILKTVSLLSIGTITTPEIKVTRGVFSSNVTVTVTHELRTPGIIRYLGIGNQIVLRTTTKKLAICPADFVRTVDLGVDLAEFLIEKFDKNGTVAKYLSKTQEYIKKIVGVL